ncbi:unnamed protein product, partial [Amoebophrya sp. A25]
DTAQLLVEQTAEFLAQEEGADVLPESLEREAQKLAKELADRAIAIITEGASDNPAFLAIEVRVRQLA